MEPSLFSFSCCVRLYMKVSWEYLLVFNNSGLSSRKHIYVQVRLYYVRRMYEELEIDFLFPVISHTSSARKNAVTDEEV